MLKNKVGTEEKTELKSKTDSKTESKTESKSESKSKLKSKLDINEDEIMENLEFPDSSRDVIFRMYDIFKNQTMYFEEWHNFNQESFTYM